MDQEDYEQEDQEYLSQTRTCDTTCSHFDELNACCWQAGEWGLSFDVDEGDECSLGYKNGYI